MAVSAWSASLRNAPSYSTRPSTTNVVNPAFPALPTLPQVPAIDEARAPNAAMRTWLMQQLGPLAQQNNAALTNIQAGAKLSLAGLGGWQFGTDNPNTAEREDLKLVYDPSAGPGEREKGAIRNEVNQANSQGMLYSSFANQNIGAALQRLTLEGQQVANQYASALNQQHAGYAGQVSSVIGQWTSLYGQDAAWLAENPPPPPPPPPPAPGASGLAQGLGLEQWANFPLDKQGHPIVWSGRTPPNPKEIQKRFPNMTWSTRQAGDGRYVVVLGSYAPAAWQAINRSHGITL